MNLQGRIVQKGGVIMRREFKLARIEKGLSIKKLAEILNISASFCYKIEQGIRNPTMVLAKQFADTLGSTVDILFFTSKLDKTSKRNIKSAYP
jgi:putative transcriptional regulator